MPQGRQRRSKKGGSSTAAASDWQRPSGGFSGAHKKAYLKQRRANRAAAGDDESGDDSDSHSKAVTLEGAQHSRSRARHRQPPSEDVSAPLHYRPLVAVPAAPFTMQGGGGGSVSSVKPDDDGVVYMPTLELSEVGWTPEGFELDMPTRPQWQGVASSAEELHALEEAEFAAWQARLLLRTAAQPAGAAAEKQQPQQPSQRQVQQGLAGGVGRVSAFEARLDFWRQLWRCLEMADVCCMILDARNPLLHVSHALYRHITQDHGLPLVLLLNKADLVPAAAAAAWQSWLQQQLPGVTVVPVSAAKEHADATARQVLDHVLQQRVRRQGDAGAEVSVHELVGLSADELVRESLLRNTHAKRSVQQQQEEHEDTAAAAAAATASDSDSDWALAPKRARKAGHKAGRKGKAAQQQQQQQQQHKQASEQEQEQPSCEDPEPESSLPPALRDAMESLMLERRLSGGAGVGSFRSAGSNTAAAAAGSNASGSSSSDGPVVVALLGEPNVGKSSTLNTLLGAHRVAVSSHPGRTKHYQTHYVSDRLVLVDCPGIVFPRLDVSPCMQVLFGSSPIASCRQPYAVVRYLAEASWPRLQDALALPGAVQPQQQDAVQQQQGAVEQQQKQQQQQQGAGGEDSGGCSSIDDVTASDGSDDDTGSSTGRSSSSEADDAEPAGLAAVGSVRGGPSVLSAAPDADGTSPFSLCEGLATKRHWVLPRSGRLDTYRAANWLMRAALGGQHIRLAFMPPADAARSLRGVPAT